MVGHPDVGVVLRALEDRRARDGHSVPRAPARRASSAAATATRRCGRTSTGSALPSAIRITSASARSARPNAPTSISAFASRTENRSCSSGASASRASATRPLEERDRRFHRACDRIRAAERVDGARIGERAPLARFERLLEQLDRLLDLLGAKCDLAETGERGRARRIARLQMGAVETLGLVDLAEPQRDLGLDQLRAARAAAARPRSRATGPRRSTRRASWLIICSDGTRAPASIREM